MNPKKPKVRLWSVLTALTAILTIAAIVGNMIANQYATTLNVALNASTYKIIKGDTTEDTEYFKAGFASDEEREAYEAELCATVEAEGAALLKNDNAALPLAGSAKVSLFGHGSVDLMYGGTGSGSVDTSKAPNLKEALEAQGIQVNQTLWDLYKSDSMMKNYSRITPASISDTLEANTQYAVNEAPWSALSSAESSFAEYGDAAIVVFSRSGGEGADLPSGTNGTNDSWISGTEGSGNYLELSAEEIELLKNLLYLLLRGTATAGVGELANFAVGLAFVLPAALLYRRRRSRRQAVIGLAAGTVCITLAGALVNYFVLLPAYSAFMGLPLDSLIQMGTAVNRHITSLGTLVVFATAPFNLVKGLFCSLIVLLIYKKLSPCCTGDAS